MPRWRRHGSTPGRAPKRAAGGGPAGRGRLTENPGGKDCRGAGRLPAWPPSTSPVSHRPVCPARVWPGTASQVWRRWPTWLGSGVSPARVPRPRLAGHCFPGVAALADLAGLRCLTGPCAPPAFGRALLPRSGGAGRPGWAPVSHRPVCPARVWPGTASQVWRRWPTWLGSGVSPARVPRPRLAGHCFPGLAALADLAGLRCLTGPCAPPAFGRALLPRSGGAGRPGWAPVSHRPVCPARVWPGTASQVWRRWPTWLGSGVSPARVPRPRLAGHCFPGLAALADLAGLRCLTDPMRAVRAGMVTGISPVGDRAWYEALGLPSGGELALHVAGSVGQLIVGLSDMSVVLVLSPARP